MKYFKISFIGSGNVAWHLSQALENCGHSIREIYSLNVLHAEKLCAKLYEAQVKEDLDFSNSKSEIIIIAVSDKAINSIVSALILPQSCIVVHTSGTVSMDELEGISDNYGVFYPVQTFSKSRTIDFRQLPFSVEASNIIAKEALAELAASLSKKIYFNTTEQRRIIHLASVFASNFTNHMFTIAKGLLESNSLSFDLIKPLITEVVNKALTMLPENSQTGPAVRKDFNTIEKHLNYLSEEEGLTEIYEAVTRDIIKTHEE